MGETVLVVAYLAPDLIEAGRTLLMELDAKSLYFDAAFWLLDGDSANWHLYLGAHSIRENGSLALYRKVNRTLTTLSLTDKLWIGMISIVDMRSKIVRALASALGTAASVDGARLDNAIVGGIQIPSCLLYRVSANQKLATPADSGVRTRRQRSAPKPT
jgi:hypothetical protein